MLKDHTVYVPADGDRLRATIDEASGIVGKPEGDRIHIYYEGNRYGAANMVTFADRVYFAASRCEFDYPTVAQAWVEPERLIEVGTFHDGHGVDVHNAEQLVALAKWLDMWDPDTGYGERFHDELRLHGGWPR